MMQWTWKWRNGLLTNRRTGQVIIVCIVLDIQSYKVKWCKISSGNIATCVLHCTLHFLCTIRKGGGLRKNDERVFTLFYLRCILIIHVKCTCTPERVFLLSVDYNTQNWRCVGEKGLYFVRYPYHNGNIHTRVKNNKNAQWYRFILLHPLALNGCH